MSAGLRQIDSARYMQSNTSDWMMSPQKAIPPYHAKTSLADVSSRCYFSDISSPSFSDSSTSSSDNTARSSTTSWTEDSLLDRAERRREQNRQSQRAFRGRKEKHRRELEDKIAAYRDQNNKLTETSIAQSEEITRLQNHVEELDLLVLSHRLSSAQSDTWLSMPEWTYDKFSTAALGDNTWNEHKQQ